MEFNYIDMWSFVYDFM